MRRHTRRALPILLALLQVVRPVRNGLPLSFDEASKSAVVAIWGKVGSAAAAIRCSGVFIAPEVVLTAAACVVDGTPHSVLQHAACATGASDCPTLPAHSLEIIDAAQLPGQRETVADVVDYEFRYSVPSAMPQVCTGGSACGEGWDIAALRVRQRCLRQLCVQPLPLSLEALRVGEPLRLVGAGVDAAALTQQGSADSHFTLRFHDGTLEAIHNNQTLSLNATASAAKLGDSGPVACAGDAGAPLLKYFDSLENTSAYGANLDMYLESARGAADGVITAADGSFSRNRIGSGVDSAIGQTGQPLVLGGWVVVGIHSRTHGLCDTNGRAWSARVVRCWLWRVLGLWHMLPSSMVQPTPSPNVLIDTWADTAQWMQRAGVERLTTSVHLECGVSDHWPPELLPPSHPLPPDYARQLADTDDAVLPSLAPVSRPASSSLCYASSRHLCVHLIRERGRLRYSIDDGRGAVPGQPLTFARLENYTFQMVGVHPVHAMVISDSETGPDRRRTQEVIGDYPAAEYGIFVFTPTLATPSTVYLQSVSRSGVGGPIHIENTAEAEPRSLPGGDGSMSPVPTCMIFWDSHGATLHHWVNSSASNGSQGSPSSATASHTSGGSQDHFEFRLQMVGYVPLASVAHAALYNRSFAAWSTAYAERMQHWREANISYVNVTNSTNQTIVYIRDGVEVNATNVTAEWAEFEKTLPKMDDVPFPAVASAVLEPTTSEVYWSTTEGHLLTASLGTRRESLGGSHQNSNHLGRLTELSLHNIKLLILGNESGTDASPWKVGLASDAGKRRLIYHNAFSVPRLVDTGTMSSDDGEQPSHVRAHSSTCPRRAHSCLPSNACDLALRSQLSTSLTSRSKEGECS